jgi:hypothetical protein
MHAILSLNTIALYREYMAFLPWNITRPDGPLDEPKIDATPRDKEYWVDQARKCFGAARDLADLLRAAKSANALVDSPIVGWATYIVAWCGEWPEVCSLLFRKANYPQLYIVPSSHIWTPIMRWTVELEKIECGSL